MLSACHYHLYHLSKFYANNPKHSLSIGISNFLFLQFYFCWKASPFRENERGSLRRFLQGGRRL